MIIIKIILFCIVVFALTEVFWKLIDKVTDRWPVVTQNQAVQTIKRRSIK